jgi:O-antigen/teichoic acid export membrane protein
VKALETDAIDSGARLADKPPSPSQPSLAYLISALAGGNVLSTVLRMAGGIVVARLLLPAALGLFDGIGLVLGYARFLQLGIFNGLNRELPYFVGKGDRVRVNELAAAAQAWFIGLGGLVGLALLGVAAWHEVHGQLERASGWATHAAAAVILFYGTMYLQATYRTAHDFARLSVANVLQNSLALLLAVLVWLLGFQGLCLRATLAAVVPLVLLHYWRPIRVKPQWSLRHLKHLCLIGLPIFGVGELYMYWTTLEGTLVFNYLGQAQMGLYRMVVTAGSTIELVPIAVSQVIYPRMAQEFGRTGQVRGLLRPTVKPMFLAAAGVAPLIVLGWFLAGPLTRLVVPNYVAAVPAMRWSLLPPLVSCFLPIHNVYNVVRRQGLYCAAIVCGMAAYLGCLVLFTRTGVSLAAFPQAMLVGRMVHVLMAYLFLFVVVRQFRPVAVPPETEDLGATQEGPGTPW